MLLQTQNSPWNLQLKAQPRSSVWNKTALSDISTPLSTFGVFQVRPPWWKREKKQAAEIWFKWRFSLLLLFLVDIPKTTWTLRNIPWRFMVGKWIYNFLLRWSLWEKGQKPSFSFHDFLTLDIQKKHSQWWGDNLATNVSNAGLSLS